MAIKLFDFQIEAVKRAISSFYQLICVRTGGGKTIIAMTYANLLLKKNLSDKVVFACTVSASAAVHAEFEEKFDIDVPIYTETEQFLDFLRDSKKKICIIKHSMFEKLGKDQNIIDGIREILTENNARVGLVIDEVHKLSNDKGLEHLAFMNIKFMFNRIMIMTATPYSSCLTQLYGIVHLINPTLWKSKTAFERDHIVEQVIKVDGKVRKKEKIAYKNLKMLREKISPFTFFYYPKINLRFFDHKVQLKDYTEYDEICKGVLTVAELDRLEGKKND